jgi:tellurite resistance protein
MKQETAYYELNGVHPSMTAAWDYWVDRSQRTVLFWDVLRRRGNVYLDHFEAGQPPVLVFDYEMVLDARTFDEPVNYALVRILNRRSKSRTAGAYPAGHPPLTQDGKSVDQDGRPMRPIVVIDPRAGHGPGIGGSKFSSQIGVALDYGHPVYFIMFYTNPEPGQTIGRVQQAEIRFLQEVAQRHPDAPKPAIIANCQAGWAAALIGADRPDVTGPMVFNGSPLSYWGGVEGANPMRYKGGLLGGVWLTSLWCDLGAGLFDGAHLVAGFEDLNPANTYWSKYYHLFDHVDTEAERYINFEKWWGGFFKLNAEEMHFIVDTLFIGNELEQGRFKLDDGREINLRNFKDPILAFASGGDNITPPPQALNWIQKVYGSVDEIKRHGQVIIYMVHDTIGHLGIFVSGQVARKEHRHILGSMGWLEFLSPGLYEMVLEGEPDAANDNDSQVRFEAREMEDLMKLDDGLADEGAFKPVNTISRFNDYLYRNFVSPWVRMAVPPPVARMIRLLHPLRVQRYMISDRNPLCWPVKWAAGPARANRRPASAENPFVAGEHLFSESIKASLDYLRDTRDLYQEWLFKSLYGNPWMQMLFGDNGGPMDGGDNGSAAAEAARLRAAARRGGYIDACVRIMIAVAGADRVTDIREFRTAEHIVQSDRRLRAVKPETYKSIVKAQARIVDADLATAVGSLKTLLRTTGERQRAYAIARRMAQSDGTPGKKETAVLAAIAKSLRIEPGDTDASPT